MTLLVSNISFAKVDKAYCDIGLKARFLYLLDTNTIADIYSGRVEALFSENFDKDQPFYPLIKDKIAPYEKCVKLHGYASDKCSELKEKLIPEQAKMMSKYQTHGAPEIICNYEDDGFIDNVLLMFGDYEIAHSGCMKDDSKDVISSQFNIPKKHIKNIKELKQEINERFKVKPKNKHCNVIPLVTSFDSKFDLIKHKKDDNYQKEVCLRAVRRVSLIKKLQQKCK